MKKLLYILLVIPFTLFAQHNFIKIEVIQVTNTHAPRSTEIKLFSNNSELNTTYIGDYYPELVNSLSENCSDVGWICHPDHPIILQSDEDFDFIDSLSIQTSYDNELRSAIFEVSVSTDGNIWFNHSSFEYYANGCGWYGFNITNNLSIGYFTQEYGTSDIEEIGVYNNNYTFSCFFKTNSPQSGGHNQQIFNYYINHDSINSPIRYEVNIGGIYNSGGEDGQNDPYPGSIGVIRTVGYNDVKFISSETFNDGEWHHLIVSKDSESMKLRAFVDDVLVFELLDQNEHALALVSEIQFGGDGSHLFNGLIDEFKLFDSSVSSLEQLVNLPNTSLKLHCDFNSPNEIVDNITHIPFPSDFTFSFFEVNVNGCSDPIANNYDGIGFNNGPCFYEPACGYSNYIEYIANWPNYSIEACNTPIVLGCTDSLMFNYDEFANTDDGSCYPIISGCIDTEAYNYDSLVNTPDNSLCIPFVYGCTDSLAFNYNVLANSDNGECIPVLNGCTDSLMFNYDQFANTDDNSCIPVIVGCMSSWADNYDINANTQNESLCEKGGCINITATNYDSLATYDNGQCQILGCTLPLYPNFNPLANIDPDFDQCDMNSTDIWGCTNANDCSGNYNPNANIDNGSCIISEIGYDCNGNINLQVGDETFGGIVFYVDETGERGLVAAVQNSDVLYEWGCNQIDVEGADGTAIGTGYQNTLDIVDQGCTTINGDITAAQAAFDAEISGYTDWFLPSIDELSSIYNNIGNGSQNDNLYYKSSTEVSIGNAWTVYFNSGSEISDVKFNTNRVCFVRSFGNWTMGCMDSLACNFNPEANMADGSCTYAEQGYDCDGNINVQVGDEAFGGIVFYVEEGVDGKYGLVAAMEDLEGSYQWGCNGINVNGSDFQFIGSGFQNTIDIIDEGCLTELGGITTAQAAYNYESEEYADWFLPSFDELLLLNQLSQSVDLNFLNEAYSSSSESNDPQRAWIVHFADSNTNDDWKTDLNHVRPIRAFGYILGCIDPLSCNYNPEANMADGSCTYAEQGHDCDGIELAYIGQHAFGGTVFYVNEDGTEGMCYPDQIIGQYEFGCFEQQIDGAYYTEIGSGENNTTSILDNDCLTLTNNGLVTAAQASRSYTRGNYYDWYLPSLDELVLLLNSSQNHNNNTYWSSSAYTDNTDRYSYGVTFNSSTGVSTDNKFRHDSYYIIPIRSFSIYENYGCTDSTSFNYDPNAEEDNGSCLPFSYGCIDESACNYNSTSNSTDNSCIYPQGCESCSSHEDGTGFVIQNDIDNDGICDIYEIQGCQDNQAFNYNSDATDDDGSCQFTEFFTDSLNLIIDSLEGQISISISNIEIVNEISDALNDSISSLETDLELSEESLSNANDSIDVLTTDLGIAGDSIDALTIDLVIAYDSISTLEIDIELSEESLVNSNAGIDALVTDLGIANDSITSLLLDIDVTEENLSIVSDSIDVLTIDLGIASDSILSLVFEISVIQSEISLLESELDSTINELTQTQLNLEASIDHINVLTDSIVLLNEHTTSLQAELSEALENQIQLISIDLLEGWNIIGYSLYEPQDAIASFQEITDIISIVKNNAGAVYMPEFGFNGIGDLIPGQGYQIKLTESYSDFTYPDTDGQRIELTPTVPQWVIDMEVDLHPNDIRTLVKVVNILGQEVDPETEPKGTVLIYLYNDATVEKKIVK